MAGATALKATFEANPDFAVKLKIAGACPRLEDELWSGVVDLEELLIQDRTDLLRKAHERDLIGKTAATYLCNHACMGGRLEAAQFLDATYFAADHLYPPLLYAFELSAEGGHLPVLQWLFQRFAETPLRERLTPSFDPIFQALEGAMRGGHLGVIRWLLEVAGFGRELLNWGYLITCCDALAKRPPCESLICEKDTSQASALEVAKYVADRLPQKCFSKEEHRAEMLRALKGLSAGGSLIGVEWLAEKLSWTREDAAWCLDRADWHPLAMAARNGHLAVVKWWVNFCGLDLIRSQTRELDMMLESACDAGHLPVVQWLVDTFAPIEFFPHGATRVLNALVRHDYRTVEWLHRRFGL